MIDLTSLSGAPAPDTPVVAGDGGEATDTPFGQLLAAQLGVPVVSDEGSGGGAAGSQGGEAEGERPAIEGGEVATPVRVTPPLARRPLPPSIGMPLEAMRPAVEQPAESDGPIVPGLPERPVWPVGATPVETPSTVPTRSDGSPVAPGDLEPAIGQPLTPKDAPVISPPALDGGPAADAVRIPPAQIDAPPGAVAAPTQGETAPEPSARPPLQAATATPIATSLRPDKPGVPAPPGRPGIPEQPTTGPSAVRPLSARAVADSGAERSAASGIDTAAPSVASGTAPGSVSPASAAPATDLAPLVDRVTQAIELQQNQPPPRTVVVDVPEVDGLRIRVGIRADGTIALATVTPAVTTSAASFMSMVAEALESRGFAMADDAPRRGMPERSDEDAGDDRQRRRRRVDRPGVRI